MASDNKIRVIIADDSYFMRKMIRELLTSDPDIEVVDEATNGVEAIRKISELKPDVVTMDYNMPELDGAAATEEILKSTDYRPGIIILSAYTREGFEAALKSLRLGAVDFVAKPSGELSLDIEKVKKELITKVKVAARARVQELTHGQEIIIDESERKEEPIQAVAIGASTGGPPLIEKILSELPASLNAALLIVQHMPEKFTRTFAELLNNKAPFPVKLAEEGELIKKGICLIAPGGKHMMVEEREESGKSEKIIHLTKEPAIHNYRPSIDALMKSAAKKYKKNLLGIILTGMGNDGLEGAREINAQGGHVIAQAPETAVVDSMPEAVINAGFAKDILSPDKIARKIVELTK